MLLHDSRDGTLYAALNLGHLGAKLHRLDAGSTTWQEVAVSAYPAKPENSSDTIAWTLQQVWSLAAGGADQPGVLWAGTITASGWYIVTGWRWPTMGAAC